MGVANYLLSIDAPSYFEWSKRSYYDRPWEVTADYYGNVICRTHLNEDIERGKAYFFISIFFGPLSYLFLPGEYI